MFENKAYRVLQLWLKGSSPTPDIKKCPVDLKNKSLSIEFCLEMAGPPCCVMV